MFRVVMILLSTLVAAAAGAQDAPQAATRQGGLAVAARLQAAPAEAGRFVARLDFTDAASGDALPGLRPAAWLQLHRSPAERELPCEDRARQFVAGSLGSRADVDLNAYRLVSLNQDRSLHFINPLVRIRNSRLEATVQLSGNGHDWVHDAASQRLAVTLRDEGRLAIVDTLTQRLAGEVDLGPGSRPTRLVLQPDSGRVWVGLDGEAALALVDLRERREVARLPLAAGPAASAGPVTLASIPGRPWLVAALAGEGSAVMVDAATHRVRGRVPVPAAPVDVAYSRAADRALVLSGSAGVLSLLAVGQDGLRPDGTVPVEPGALVLAVPGDGRHVLVSNVKRHDVALVDLARRAVSDRAPVPEWPDQIVATRDHAYVRSQSSNRFTLFALDALRAGRLQPVTVPIGRASAADMPEAINVAPAMAVAPEGNGIYAAVAGDAQIYRYAEGLMVPSGSLDNYRRPSRALMVLDESLREVSPGRFEVPLRLRQGGRYELVVRNASPAVTACMTVALEGPEEPATAAAPSAPRPKLVQWAQRGRELRFTVQLDGESAPMVTDLQALLLGPRGAWQRRSSLEPAGVGRWQATVELPEQTDGGAATLLLQSAQLGLAYTGTRLGSLSALLPAGEGIDAPR